MNVTWGSGDLLGFILLGFVLWPNDIVFSPNQPVKTLLDKFLAKKPVGRKKSHRPDS